MNISEMVTQAHQTAVEHGFWEDRVSTGEAIALIHSELSEALEECRAGKPDLYFTCPHHDTRSGCPDSFDGCQHGENAGCDKRKPEGLAVELADAVIRIGDLCGALNIDLEAAIALKMEYNKKRPYKHGKLF